LLRVARKGPHMYSSRACRGFFVGVPRAPGRCIWVPGFAGAAWAAPLVPGWLFLCWWFAKNQEEVPAHKKKAPKGL